MTDKRPKALLMADGLEFFHGINLLPAAAELRRLHEMNAELVRAVRLLLNYPDGQYGTSDDYKIACDVAEAAIAKATGDEP